MANENNNVVKPNGPSIDKAITRLRGTVANVNASIQAIAVAIVTHAFGTGEGQGSNDVSRAQKLLATIPNSMNRTYLIRWFRMAGIAVNPSEGYSAKVVAKDAKDYRQPSERIDFAKANNWYEAVGDNGERAPWYQGPTPKEQEPNTMVDFAENIVNFADRTAKNVKEGKLRGTDKPMYVLSDEQQKLVAMALNNIRHVALALRANATKDEAERELAKLRDAAAEGLTFLQETGKPVPEEVEEVAEPAAAGAR